MHSKIFQVSKKPIVNEITEMDLYGAQSFVGPIADYVSDMDPEAQACAITWLGGKPGIRIDGDTLTITSKKEFFAADYEAFHEAIREASTKTLDEFVCPNMGWALYEIRQSIRDEYGFYIVETTEYHENLVPLADFMRNAADGEVYHLGSVLDYHY